MQIKVWPQCLPCVMRPLESQRDAYGGFCLVAIKVSLTTNLGFAPRESLQIKQCLVDAAWPVLPVSPGDRCATYT